MKELGILVPLVTPCTRAGEVDHEGLRAVCDDVLAAGCHGIFVGGSTGRGPWFSRPNRAKMCRTIADQIGTGVPLFAGCIAAGLPEMLENAHTLADAGAQAVVVTAPGYYNYSQEEVEIILGKLADASPLPVLIYDIPAFAGMKLDLEMTSRLAGHENVTGFKDSSADMDRFRELAARLAEARDFYLLQGKEGYLADSLLIGASGFVVSLVQVDPRPFVALYGAVRAGDLGRARCIQEKITEVLALVEDSLAQRPATSTLFHFLNYALRQRGVCDNILLDHEGDCPGWLAANARKALEICEAACAHV